MAEIDQSGQSGRRRRESTVEKASRLYSGGAASPPGAAEPAVAGAAAAAAPAPLLREPLPAANGGNGAAEARPAGRRSRRVDIDLDRLREAGVVTSHVDHTSISEEFRIIKRPLLLKALEKGPQALRNSNLIMVSSAHSGEGKTFCSVSLAMSIALERDLTVLLVDADVAKPEIPRMFGFEADQGLVDLIVDENLEMSDVLVRTNLENLSVLPAGRPHHLATELLASEKMGRMIEEIAQRYPDRIIIFDSPPVLYSSIAGVLALHVGQTLFVVEADRTTQVALDSALSLINSCKNISLVLNKTRSIGGAEKYGSYYNSYSR
ncbi:MAG: XrtA-associated tyrosine autokinase [Rhodospirillales bacterium]